MFSCGTVVTGFDFRYPLIQIVFVMYGTPMNIWKQRGTLIQMVQLNYRLYVSLNTRVVISINFPLFRPQPFLIVVTRILFFVNVDLFSSESPSV